MKFKFPLSRHDVQARGKCGDAPNEGDGRVNLVTLMCSVTTQRGPLSPGAIHPCAAAAPGGALALSQLQCAFNQKIISELDHKREAYSSRLSHFSIQCLSSVVRTKMARCDPPTLNLQGSLNAHVRLKTGLNAQQAGSGFEWSLLLLLEAHGTRAP